MADTVKKSQPKQLYMLFFTEMWERFSFYGMRALLTLYMTLQLFEDMADPEKKAKAFGIYAAYGALVYATPYLGGLIADKIIGYKKSTIWGGILMMIGHFVMAIETEFFLYLALAFLIVGNGFFKPNISSMVGGLYGENDPRRDGGFTIFYMGINLGAALAPLICGYIGETYGWFYGFGLAGIGMLFGLIVFWRGKDSLGENGDPPNPAKLAGDRILGLNKEYIIYIGSIIVVAMFAGLVRYYELLETIIPFVTIAVLVWILISSFKHETVAKNRLWVILVLTIFNILFWAFFEQAGSSLTLFTESNIDRNIFGFNIPTSTFQSVNPIFILLLAPLFATMWLRLNTIGKEPSTPLKFVIGLILLGLGFLTLYFGLGFISFNEGMVLMPIFFLIFSYFLQTSGELSLSPVGLSMITKLAPKGMVAQLMGVWFLSTAFSHNIAGQIAKLTAGDVDQNLVESVKESYDRKEVGVEEMQVLADWGGQQTAQIMKTGIEDSILSQNQLTTLVSGNRYEVRKLLQTTVISFYLSEDQLPEEGVDKEINKAVEDGKLALELEALTKSKLDSLLEVATSAGGTMKLNTSLLHNKFKNALGENFNKEKVTVTYEIGKLSPTDFTALVESSRQPGLIALGKNMMEEELLEKKSEKLLSSFDTLANYLDVYRLIGFISIGAGILLLVLVPVLRKWMHGIH